MTRYQEKQVGSLQVETEAMEPIPSLEATSRSAIQEIPDTLLNPKVHYCVHKGTPLVQILSHMNSVDTTTSYCTNIYYYYILDGSDDGV
jgi:hypothetical protein